MNEQQYYFGNMDASDVAKLKDIKTLNELLDYCKAEFGDRDCLEDVGGKHTYNELIEDVGKARGWLVKQGFKAGDHIALMFLNEYDFVKMFFAVETLGMVSVIFPIQLPMDILPLMLKKYDCKALAHSRILPLTDAIGVKTVAGNLASDAFVEPYEVDGSAPACIIFTGGTTGKQKGVVLSQNNLCVGMKNGALGTKNVFFNKYLAIIPFSHVFGLIRSLLTAFYTGSCVFTCDNPKNLLRDLDLSKPSTLILVPALAEMVFGLMMMKGREFLPNLTTIICGAANVPPVLFERFKKFGVDVFPGYGLTESSNLVSGNVHPIQKPTSVGMPYPHQELKVVDKELWIKGDNIMLEYYKDPEANAEAFEDGWFKTGDLVAFDEDGELYIIGRKKNLIILSNGENVSPEEVEEQIKLDPEVKDVLVFEDSNNGMPCLAAEIYPQKQLLDACSDEELQAKMNDVVKRANDKMPSFMSVVKVYVRREDFPRSGSMKIIRGKK